ncbi:MAG: MFS transporter [Terriglobia bacterium]
MAIWSVAEIAHAKARGLFSLSACRLALGVGEAGHWPAATKTAAEWFPSQERALVMGIINSGAAIGSAVAAPLGSGWNFVSDGKSRSS